MPVEEILAALSRIRHTLPVVAKLDKRLSGTYVDPLRRVVTRAGRLQLC
jgi:hypothetical protein